MQGPLCEQQASALLKLVAWNYALEIMALQLDQHYSDETHAKLDEAEKSGRGSRIKSGCIRKWPPRFGCFPGSLIVYTTYEVDCCYWLAGVLGVGVATVIISQIENLLVTAMETDLPCILQAAAHYFLYHSISILQFF